MFNIRRRLLVAACTAGIFGGSIALAPTFNVLAAEEAEPNNSRDTATEIETNTDVSGITDQAGVDWYKFTLTEDCRINIYGTIVSTDCPYDYFTQKVNLYNSKELLIAETAFNRDASLGQQSSKPIGLESGTYYLSVPSGDPNWPNDEYVLNIHTDSSEKWETEGYNNSKNGALEIEANSDVHGMTDQHGADWYKFTLTEDCRINVYGTIVSTDCPYNYFTQKINLYNSEELLIAEDAFYRDPSLGEQTVQRVP